MSITEYDQTYITHTLKIRILRFDNQPGKIIDKSYFLIS